MSDKRTQIILAAIRQFANEGISVPAAKIAKEAGVSNGTLFNYFKTKQDLIDETYFYINEKIANKIIGQMDIEEESLRVLLFGIWCSYIGWANKNPLEHQVLGMLRTSKKLGDDVIHASDSFFEALYEKLKIGITNREIIFISVHFLGAVAVAQLDATINYIKDYNLNAAEADRLSKESFDIYWNGIVF
jgi:AcrR family transcriptional regulator